MKSLLKESIVSIKKNIKRFLSILAIVLLGVGFFVGIRVTSPNMQKTVDEYFEDTNFLDLDILSTWGITDTDISYIKDKGFVGESSYQIDAIVEGETEEVAKVISFDSLSEMNKPILLDGKFPEKDDECVIEENKHTKLYKIGDIFTKIL